jgi:transposase
MHGYSIDLRQRIVAAVERGMPRQDVVATFGVSLGTIKRLLAKHRRGQDLAPSKPPGRKPTISPDQYPALLAQLNAHPDATFLQHAELWNQAHGTDLSQWTLGRAIRRSGWTRKKNAQRQRTG